eukprot:02458_2
MCTRLQRVVQSSIQFGISRDCCGPMEKLAKRVWFLRHLDCKTLPCGKPMAGKHFGLPGYSHQHTSSSSCGSPSLCGGHPIRVCSTCRQCQSCERSVAKTSSMICARRALRSAFGILSRILERGSRITRNAVEAWFSSTDLSLVSANSDSVATIKMLVRPGSISWTMAATSNPRISMSSKNVINPLCTRIWVPCSTSAAVELGLSLWYPLSTMLKKASNLTGSISNFVMNYRRNKFAKWRGRPRHFSAN